MRRVAAVLLGALVLIAFLARHRILSSAYRLEGALQQRFGYSARPTAIPYATDYSWAQANPYVAHALGGIGGNSYTNSREAFLQNYDRGFRVFEVDLSSTADGAVVARHDWDAEKRRLTLAEFRSHPIAGRHTPLAWEDLLQLLVTHADAYLVLDIKDSFYELLSQVVEQSRRLDEKLPLRIIPQLYSERDLKWALWCYSFPSFIYTLYLTDASDADVVRFTEESGVRAVTLSDTRFSPQLVRQLADKKIYVYVHTINSAEKVSEYRSQGAHGVYTDFLDPGRLP